MEPKVKYRGPAEVLKGWYGPNADRSGISRRRCSGRANKPSSRVVIDFAELQNTCTTSLTLGPRCWTTNFPTLSNKTAVSQHTSRSRRHVLASFGKPNRPRGGRTGRVFRRLVRGRAKSIEAWSFGVLLSVESRQPISPALCGRRPNPPAHVCPMVGGFRSHSGCSRRPGRRGERRVARPALEMTTRLNREVCLRKQAVVQEC